MTITINVNGLTLCHRGSGGVTHNTLPDVCKTPDKGIPFGFENEAYSKDLDKGTTSVFADGGNMIANYGSIFATSVFDEGGSMLGIISNTHLAEAEFITHSFDVFFERKPACRLTDKMFMNHRNTVNMSGEWQKDLSKELIDKICEAICECRKKMAPTLAQAGELAGMAVEALRGVQDTDEKASALNETHRRQECFAKQFNQSGIPWYGAKPKDMSVLTEVPYKMPTDLILSESGRTTGPGITGPTAPASVLRALSVARGSPGTVVIWDMVVLNNPKVPATWDNVKKVLEIKFNGDKYTKNQERALQDGDVSAKVERVDEADCYCDDEDERKRREVENVAKQFSDNLLKYMQWMPWPGPRGGGLPIPH